MVEGCGLGGWFGWIFFVCVLRLETSLTMASETRGGHVAVSSECDLANG